MTISPFSCQSPLSHEYQLSTSQDPLWAGAPLPPLDQHESLPDSTGEMGLLVPELPVPYSEVRSQSANPVHQVARGCFEACTLSEKEVVEVVSPQYDSYQLTLDGVAYQLGLGYEKNSAKAIALFLQAGGLENCSEVSELGIRYLTGNGGIKDELLALTIFFAGSDFGDLTCKYWLRVCCAHGVGVPSVPQTPLQDTLNVQAVYDELSRIELNPQIMSGIAYQLGVNDKKNSEKAVACFLQASGLENLQQLSKLGIRYLLENSSEHASKLARIVFSAGADLKDPACRIMLQLCCETGNVVQGQPKMPIESLLGIPTSQDPLSRLEPSPTSPVISYEFLAGGYVRSALNEGEIGQTPPKKAMEGEALNTRGLSYYYGRDGKVQNLKKAFARFSQAAKAGNAFAKCNLGYCCVYGRGCESERFKGVKLLKEGVKGCPAAVNGLAIAILTTCKDKRFSYKKFINLLEHGASNCIQVCLLNLATCYQFGIGVDSDLPKSAQLCAAAKELRSSKEQEGLIAELLYQLTPDDARRIKKEFKVFGQDQYRKERERKRERKVEQTTLDASSPLGEEGNADTLKMGEKNISRSMIPQPPPYEAISPIGTEMLQPSATVSHQPNQEQIMAPDLLIKLGIACQSRIEGKKRKVEKTPSSASPVNYGLQFIQYDVFPSQSPIQKRLLDAKRQPSHKHQSLPDPSSDHMQLLLPKMSVSALEQVKGPGSLSHQDSSISEECAEPMRILKAG